MSSKKDFSLRSSQESALQSFLKALRYFRNLCLGIVALGACGLFYLSLFPVSLNFLKPFLVAQEQQLGFSLEKARLDLTWRGWNHIPEIQVSNLQISFPLNNMPVSLSAPKIYLTPSWGKFLRGEVHFQSVILKDPSFNFSKNDSNKVFSQESLRLFLKEALQINQLKSLSLRIENPFPHIWPHLSLQFTRTSDALHLNLRDPNGSWGEAIVFEELETQKIKMEITLEKVTIPRTLLPFIPLRHLPLLSGNIKGSFASESPDQEGTFLIAGDTNHVPNTLEKVFLEGSWTHKGLRLSQGTLQKEGVIAQLKGEWQDIDSASEKKVALEARMSSLSLKQLNHFWPEELATNARTWILQNMTEGKITESTLQLCLTLDSEGSVLSQKVSGTLALDGLTIHYLEGMPPAQKVRGTALFSENAFDIKITSGILQSQKLTHGNVWITGLDLPDQTLKTNLNFKGPLTDLLKILAFPPLEYPQKISIPLDAMKASAETTLDISFPLEKEISLSQVDLKAREHLTQFSYTFPLPTPSKPLRFEKGDLTLVITPEKIDLKGKAVLNQIPVTTSWKEFFHDPQTRTIGFEANITPLRLNQWGIHLEDFIQGTFPLKIQYRPYNPTPLSFEADLSPVHLNILALNWTKEEGKPAQLSGLIQTRPKKTEIQKLTLESPEMSVKGMVSLSPSYGFKALSLSEIKSPRNDCALHFEETSQGTVLTLKGVSADLGGFFNSSSNTTAKRSLEGKNLRAVLNLETVYVGSDDPLYDLKGFITGFQKSTGFEITTAHMGAQFTSSKSPSPDQKKLKGAVSLIFQKPTPDEQSILLESDNGGYLLKALGLITNLRSGNLKITASRKNPQTAFKGKMTLENFTVTRTPFLTQVLMTLASPTSFLGLFSNGKIDFIEFSCDMIWDSPLLKIKEGLFQNLSSGISLEGTVNTEKKVVNLQGNLIPAYIINKPLSAIPIIGDILGGGKGDGIGATRFFVKGPIDAPSISVNPMQIIAPGIIKKFFSIFQNSSEDVASKEAP